MTVAQAKRALVTGGIGGIGSSICEELAKAGCHVTAAHHPAEAEAARARLVAWQGLALPPGADHTQQGMYDRR